MKKFIYISYVRFPSERAHAVYIAKVCEAFLSIGTKCSLLVPRRFGASKDTPRKYFNLSAPLTVVRIPSVDLFPFKIFMGLAHRIGLVSFTFCSLLYVLFRVKKDTVILTNDVLVAFFILLIHKKTTWEVHDYPKKSFLYKKVLTKSWRILTNNNQKKTKLIKDFEINEKKILALHNGIDLKVFDIDISKEEARKKLGLPIDQKIVMYTGSLQSWKGAEVLADAGKRMKDVSFYFVGGNKADVERFKEHYKDSENVVFTGAKPYSEMPVWQKSADMLVLPNTAKDDLSKYHTSPMKLFEYMASKRPIIATNIPSITEVLSTDTSVLVEPDNTDAIVKAIRSLSQKEVDEKSITKNAFGSVQEYTWDKRADKLVTFLKDD